MSTAVAGRVSLTSRDWLVALVLGALVTPLAWGMSWSLVGIFHDDGVYVATAKALATGRGYRLLDLPGEPWQTKYPILFPALLSVVWRVWPDFPANVGALRAVPLASTFAAAAVTYLYAVRFGFGGRLVAAAAVVAAFSAPQLASLYGLIVSEPLFTLLLTLAVWRIDRLTQAETPREADQWLAGAALGACVATRSIGLFVVAGGLLHLAVARRLGWRTAATAVLPAVLWFGWVGLVSADEGTRLGAYNTSYIGWWATHGWPALATVIRDNLIGLVVHGGYIAAEGAGRLLLGEQPGVTASLVSGALLMAAVAAGVARWRTGSVSILAVYVLAVVVWPWPPARFLIPVMPLACVLACGGVAALVHRHPVLTRAFTVAVCLWALVTLTASASLARAVYASGGLYGARPERSPAWTDFEAAFRAVRTLTPPGAVVASLSEPMVYLYADRQGTFVHEHDTIRLHYTMPPSIGTADEVYRTIREGGATHVLRLPMGSRGVAEMFDRILDDLSQSPEPRIRLVAEDRRAGFALYELTDVDSRRE